MSAGTWKHEVLHRALASNAPPSAPILDEFSWLDAPEAFEWLRQELPEAWGGLREFEVEVVLTLDGEEHIGHADLVVTMPDRDLVIDWKTGYQPDLPPIWRDYQMQGYAVAVWQGGGRESPVDVARVVIDRRRIDWLSLDQASLESAEQALAEIVSDAAGGELTPGRHCGGCLVKLACPAYLSLAEALVGPEVARAASEAEVDPADLVVLSRRLGPAKDALDVLKGKCRDAGLLKAPPTRYKFCAEKVVQRLIHAIGPLEAAQVATSAMRFSKSALVRALVASGKYTQRDAEAWVSNLVAEGVAWKE